MTSKTQQQVLEYFKAHGPGTSADYISAFNLEKDRGRQQVSRALKAYPDKLCTLKSIRMESNAQIIYVQEQQEAFDFPRKLEALFEKHRSIYAHALRAIHEHGGVLSIRDFEIFSGAPTKKRKKQLQTSSVIENLIENKIVFKHIVNDESYISTCEEEEIAHRAIQAYQLRSKLAHNMIDMLSHWLKDNGMASYDKIERAYTGAKALVGHYRWSLTAPSYLSCMKQDQQGHGFIVADVHLDHITPKNMAYFIKKVDALQTKNMRPVMVFLMAPSFSKEAWNEGKTRGYVLVHLKAFFGKIMGEAFQDLVKIYNDPKTLMEGVSVETVGEMLKAFNQFGLDEGRLRGDLFELIAYTLFKEGGYYVDFGVEDKHNEVEIDVIAHNRSEVVMVECKAYRENRIALKEPEPGEDSDKKGIYHWLHTRIPRMQAHCKSKDALKDSNKSRRFEFWTTSTFEPDAIAYVKNFNENTKKYEVHLVDRHELLQKVKNWPSLKAVLETHFNPLKLPRTQGPQEKTGLPKDLWKQVGPLENQLTFSNRGEIVQELQRAISVGKLKASPTASECATYLHDNFNGEGPPQSEEY